MGMRTEMQPKLKLWDEHKYVFRYKKFSVSKTV